jgi:hypothetical protein
MLAVQFYFLKFVLYANVAQMVEQLTRNEQVGGSSPPVGSQIKFIITIKDKVTAIN